MAQPTIRPTLVVLAASSLLAATAAQNNESRGVLAGAPTTVLVDGASPGGADDGTTLVHPSGFGQTPPVQFGPNQALAPDLRRIVTAYGASPDLDLDDYSSGRDDLLIDSEGVLDIDPHEWSIWSFSLRDGAVGVPGSRIAEQAIEGDVGAALFSYVLPGSGLPPEVVGRVERSHSRQDLGLAGAASLDVDGIDQPIVLGLDQASIPTGFFAATEPNWSSLLGQPKLYFTVSSATVHLVPTSWWGGTTPSGATVFVVRPAATTVGWLPPVVFRSYEELGLDPAEDIDALAIDEPNEKILFSVVGTARDQFLFLQLGADGTPTPIPVVKTDGTTVGSSVGKGGDDDVDAVCTLDPNLETFNVGNPDDFGSSCGAPRNPYLGVTPEISGSAFRRYENGQIFFDSWMVGWPDATGPTPSLSFALLTSVDLWNPVMIALPTARNPNDPIPGNPQSLSLAIPSALSLSSARLSIRWFHYDWSQGVSEAWPVQIFL
ncbi:MAG: hypothetical protein AB8H80_18115 [Planctomycetota bacterium]